MKGIVGWAVAAALACGMAAGAGEYKFVITTDKPDAIYAKGEKAVFTIDLLEDGKSAKEGKVVVRLLGDLKNLPNQVLTLDGQPKTVEASLDAPGWIMIEAQAMDADGKPIQLPGKDGKLQGLPKGLMGAMVAPEEIKPAVPEPADFDAFWKSQREALDKVPVKAELKEASVPKDKGDFVCYDVQVDCAGPKPVSGYLTLPKGALPKSLAAVVSYHGAGVRSAGKSFRNNALSFDVNAHGIPNGQPGEFYKALSDGELKNYRVQNATDRETVYFKDMYLRVMRALEYIKTRPEWDGKTLIVSGGSQGGGQSLVAAALDHDVTLCSAGVAALGDHNARSAGRTPGWPKFVDAGMYNAAQKPEVAKVVAYYDNVNFAKRIQCETIMSVGFVDTTCPPTSVYAAYNNIPAGVKKAMDATPGAGHGAKNNLGSKRIAEILQR